MTGEQYTTTRKKLVRTGQVMVSFSFASFVVGLCGLWFVAAGLMALAAVALIVFGKFMRDLMQYDPVAEKER